MHLIAVKDIPDVTRKGSGRNDVRAILDEFMKAKYTKAEVIINKGEYCSVDVAYRTIISCVANSDYSGRICVMKRGSRIYIRKIRR